MLRGQKFLDSSNFNVKFFINDKSSNKAEENVNLEGIVQLLVMRSPVFILEFIKIRWKS